MVERKDPSRFVVIGGSEADSARPQGDSPLAKMAAALRGKAAAERCQYERRVQSGEWGPMPEAGTQADFCIACDGTGWDGDSREKTCQTCAGSCLAARPQEASDAD